MHALVLKKHPPPPPTQFYDLVGEIWYPKYLFHLHQRESKIVRGEEQQPRARDLHLYFTDYIVVGPTSSDLQRDTGIIM